MNGIYDFEQYKPPYIDVEMLQQRKEENRRRFNIFLSCVAILLMLIMTIVIFGEVLAISQVTYIVVYSVFGIYSIVVTLIVGKYLKLGEKLCL